MQTFLPYPDFLASAHVLDRQRLGKQRVETLQILRALELPEYGWQNHPAVRMWRGRTPALVRYGLDCVRVWTGRGHDDSTAHQIAEFAPWVGELSQADLQRESLLPGWLGDERLHRSHRSQLLAKDPDFYRPLFGETAEGLDYFWPAPDPVADEPGSGSQSPLWVLRPESEQVLGRAVLTGVVGFGAAADVPVDASVGEIAVLRELQGNPGRRPSRALRALADFVQAVQPGDDIAMVVSGGESLLIGRVTGPYTFAPRDTAGLMHRRTVDWYRVYARSAMPRPAALQGCAATLFGRLESGVRHGQVFDNASFAASTRAAVYARVMNFATSETALNGRLSNRFSSTRMADPENVRGFDVVLYAAGA